MITGHLQVKRGIYQMVINLKGKDGKWKPKWKSTGLKEKGNKTRALQMLNDTIRYYEEEEARQQQALAYAADGKIDILFSEYMEKHWLPAKKSYLEASTYTSYRYTVEAMIIPWFEDIGCTLRTITPIQIADYYSYLLSERNVKENTVLRHHAYIRNALQMAVKSELIDRNVADLVTRPRAKAYQHNFYDIDELKSIFALLEEERHFLELPVKIAAYLGLRRSEVLGLKWSSIDFEGRGYITMNHTVTGARDDDGVYFLDKKDRGKNKSSLRTLPMIPQLREVLLQAQEQQVLQMQRCGNAYNKEYEGYVCVDALGFLLDPNSLTKSFPYFLEKHGKKRIRFHDLRHSCASLLLKAGLTMKEIQEWLGHSNYQTTANIYVHLDTKSKEASADKLGKAFQLGFGADNELRELQVPQQDA